MESEIKRAHTVLKAGAVALITYMVLIVAVVEVVVHAKH